MFSLLLKDLISDFILAMLELCTEDGLTRGHVYDMGSVWEKYKKKNQTPMNLKYHRSICKEGSLLLRTYKNDLGTKQTLYAP